MKAYTALAISIASFAGAASTHAAEPGSATGPYAGIGLGISGFELHDSPSPASGSDLRSQSLKLYWGYQLTPYFGAEVGYARTGEVSETRIVDGVAVTQTAKSRAVYAAATGQVALTQRFTLTGRLGVSYGDVNGQDPIGGAESVFGRKASLMGGFGTRYGVNEHMSIALDVDYVGKESDRVSAGIFTLTARRSF